MNENQMKYHSVYNIEGYANYIRDSYRLYGYN